MQNARLDKTQAESRLSGETAITSDTQMMPFAATWMDVETVVLSGVSQIKNDKYH